MMPILNKIFHKAFGNLAGNKKAIADQGWFPPTRKLLEHLCFSDEINNHNSTANSLSCSGISPSTPSLNIFQENRMAATVQDKMLGDKA